MKAKKAVINDRMQRGYTYELTQPAGRNFDDGFEPDPASWFRGEWLIVFPQSRRYYPRPSFFEFSKKPGLQAVSVALRGNDEEDRLTL
jgi:hypothetical protein